MPILYLDMDGVLADFNQLAQQVLGATAEDQANADRQGRWPQEQWAKLRSIKNFYRILPKTDIADELVATARQFRDNLGWELYVLTAIPKGNDMPEAFQDKVEWMQEHYPDIRVRFGPYSIDKAKHARRGDYLVDDRVSNCREWEVNGGTAIKVDLNRTAALQEVKMLYERKLSFNTLMGTMPDQG
jgi:5'(3')-deoxyribonucleotidase